MTPATAELLRCPLCGDRFEIAPSAMRCGRGHHFDVARQGYVNLLTGRTPSGADTQDMVTARAEFLAAGHFTFLTEALAEAAHTLVGGSPEPAGIVVDVGAGPGHHLAAVLDRLPRHRGLALDVATPAARRAVRAHERVDAAVCDTWRGLPVADACADLVLDVFAPRNGSEFRRVLRPTGALLVVTPRPDHLAELVGALGLLAVDPGKDRRLGAALGRWFTLESETAHERRLTLTREDASRVVAMGPSAWHTDPAHLAARLTALPSPLTATAAVILRTYRPTAPI